jgi:type 2 lantibiotic biosynthesis protein LanM
MDAPGASAARRSRDIDRMLGRVVGPHLTELADQLRALDSLSDGEVTAMVAGAATAVREAIWRRVGRMMVLELNAARLAGKLTAADSAGRWEQWVAGLEQPGAWEALAAPYPTLLTRMRQIAANRCTAAHTMASRFTADRDRLATLLPAAPGELREVRFGAGDSHHGGQTVAVLGCDTGRVVYKPRPVAVDLALGRLLPRLLPAEPADTRIRVPAVLSGEDQRGRYGWAAYEAHRYCADQAELRCFYRGLGHWLAVMRLLRGSDLHFENLVAVGPVPVVVDCETLFSPYRVGQESGFGAAVDLAYARVGQSVLRTGLLPGRGAALGWRGADPSAAGRLPGEQPMVKIPMIVNLGTDQPRVGTGTAPAAPGTNLPSPEPALRDYWPVTVAAFIELSQALQERDRAGELTPLLAGFADCPVRVVLRDTASYAEIERMLWHPTSLHRPEPAYARAMDLLVRHARNSPAAPADRRVIEAELADLLDGDVPVFTTTPAQGVLAGPRGTRWGPPEDLIDAAVSGWREADLSVDRQVVEAALVGAYLNIELGPRRRPRLTQVRAGELERRRRGQAAAILRRLAQAAIRGHDGTVTWVSPVLELTGWAVRPLGTDLYAGSAGVAVLLAAYHRELSQGRADEVPEAAPLLAAVVATLRLAEQQQAQDRVRVSGEGVRLRPSPCGAYLGLASRIWAWLLLGDLGAVDAAEAQQRAVEAAELLPEAFAADEQLDLLAGMAGAVVPLLRLAGRTGVGRWQELARQIGQRLGELAQRQPAGACWLTQQYPQGIGGLSHGATGFGWALARLAAATGDSGSRELADAAFGFEESLYDRQAGGWRDARAGVDESITTALWCHGSVGIGIAAADLLGSDPGAASGQRRDVLARAAQATWPAGFGATHTLCHGELSAWELLDRAWVAGVGPAEVDREQVVAHILTGMEDHGPASGLTNDVFSPGLMSGLGGVAYQLLRMHPDSQLPSVLLPDPGPG